ncbi:MAG: 2-phosphosulfolactate phosphatase, partial [Armatimonadota bacterium]
QDRDVALLMAGFAQDQTRLNLEDLLSCGCLVDRLGIEPANDAAKGALYAFRYVGVTGLTRQFLATDHGRHLVKLGRQQDILFLAEPDRLGMVAARRAVVDLPGGRAVELTAHSPVGG